MSQTPPLPADSPARLSPLRVGITGHRLDKLSDHEMAAICDRLGDLFRALDAALVRLAERDAEAPRSCRLVSALAEGADRLAVDAAPPGWPLDALLPMPRAIYRHDFLSEGQETSASAEAFDRYLARAETIAELPMLSQGETGAPRIAQYAAHGVALVARIDCLVAIWDGKPPAGPGGTATVIAAAMERNLTVLWIDWTGRLPPRRIERLRNGDIAQPVSVALDTDALAGLTFGLRPR